MCRAGENSQQQRNVPASTHSCKKFPDASFSDRPVIHISPTMNSSFLPCRHPQPPGLASAMTGNPPLARTCGHPPFEPYATSFALKLAALKIFAATLPRTLTLLCPNPVVDDSSNSSQRRPWQLWCRNTVVCDSSTFARTQPFPPIRSLQDTTTSTSGEFFTSAFGGGFGVNLTANNSCERLRPWISGPTRNYPAWSDRLCSGRNRPFRITWRGIAESPESLTRGSHRSCRNLVPRFRRSRPSRSSKARTWRTEVRLIQPNSTRIPSTEGATAFRAKPFPRKPWTARALAGVRHVFEILFR